MKRRNVFRVAVAYLAVSWLLIQIAETIFPLFEFPDSAARTVVILVAILFVPTLIFSWFFELTPGGFVRDKDLDRDVTSSTQPGRKFDFTIIGLLSVALIYFVSTHDWNEEDGTGVFSFPEKSVAVLPFVNMSGNPDNEYFSDGLTETLLHTLAQLPGLKVSARTSAFFYKGQDIDIREVAENLGVQHVLKGSVQREGNKVRIVAQLIEAETGFHLWSQTYDREMTDIFAVQDDIALSVAAAMKVTLAGGIGQGGSKIESVGTHNVAAYEKYLQGLQQKNIFNNTSLLLAKISFESALALDPDFFEARLELAHTYQPLGAFGVITQSDADAHVSSLLNRLREERPEDLDVLVLNALHQGVDAIDVEKLLTKLQAAAEESPSDAPYKDIARLLDKTSRPEEAFEWRGRGLVVDPNDWQLHFHRAAYMRKNDDLDGAEAAFARAIELNPDNPMLLDEAAIVASRRGDYAQWFAMTRSAMEADPLAYDFWPYIAIQLYTLGLMDEGDRYLQRGIEIAPDRDFTRAGQLYRLMLQDDYEGARNLSETMLRDKLANQVGIYRIAALVFVSTMIELDRTTEALAFFEQLVPGVTSPSFWFADYKEAAIQFYAALALAGTPANEEILRALDKYVAGAEQAYPRWEGLPDMKTQLALAHGNMDMAVENALEDLDGRRFLLETWDWPLRYQHIYFFKELAKEPLVAERLRELEAEAKKGGEDIWAYIVEHDLQLLSPVAP